MLAFCSMHVYSQTTLATGDIAIVGLNSDGDDEFSFLLLKDITAGTVIYITDKGWNDASGFYSISGDGIWQWTTSTALSAGTIVHIKTSNNGVLEAGSLAATPGTVTWVENNSTIIAYSGDQIFLYQGTAANPVFITGCSWNVETYSTVGNWDGSCTTAQTSALPDQLTTGVNAIWLYGPGPTEYDNFRYKCSVLTSGTPSALRASINNINNWDVDLTNTTAYTLNPFPCSFTVASTCVNPSVPTVTASPSSVCPGSSSTLSITGTLNDATAWHIYTGSCGGTSIGTTATTTFSVSPSSSTTYYVRGEGGCVTPGSCGSATVTVKPSYNLSETDEVCSGDSYTFPDGTTQGNITIQIVHTSNLQTSLLCDSIIQTTVNVNPVYNLSETKYVCSGGSYTFPDGTTQTNITSQVIHTSNLLTVGKMCDSIIQTTVNVNPVYNLTETDYVCSGDSYTFPDGTTQNNITSQVIHTSNLQTVLTMCDSIIVTTINVNPVYDQTETVYVCSGDSYTFPDGTTQSNITSQVVHTSNFLTAVTMCDSIIVTTVNVNPVYNLTETDYVCSGGSYTFPDGTTQTNITSQIVHTSNFQTVVTLCDSIIVTTLNVSPVYNLTETDYVCSGGSYTFPDGTTQTNITSQVIHTSNLLTAVTMCDSIIQTTVNVSPVYNLTETDYVCSGDSYTFHDGTTQNNITSQVVHTSNLQTAVTMCDSIIVTTINVNPVYDQTETVYVCSGGSYTFPDGTTQSNITSQVMHTSNFLTAVTMCDSIIVTTVNVNPVYDITEIEYVCSGSSYTFPDGTIQNNITSQVIHTSNLQTVLTMCDSIIQTTVNVDPVYNIAETDYVCSGDSYTFPDGTTQNNITSQVVYTSNLQTVLTMCDSIIVTTINVNPVYNLTETDYVCSGDSYTFPDGTTQNNITSQVVYTSNLQTAVTMCDSIIVTTVNVNPVYNLTETVYVCPGESYTFPDGTIQNNITSQVVYTSNLQTVATMCDSIIQTTVNVSPVYNLTETDYVCSGDSYTFPDGTIQTNITSQVVYTSNLQTAATMCDSIIQTTVNVNPVYNIAETYYVCSGDSYTFPDGTTQDNITSQVVYTSNLLTAVTMCDSIIETTINVNPSYNLTETVNVCPGASYTFPDGTTESNITSQVIHFSNFQTMTTSCDSIIETTVNVNPVYNLTETVYVCPGGSYTFPDGSTQSDIVSQIVYTSNLQTVVTLCDSIIETTVNVAPVYNLTETVYVCPGGSYTFPDGTVQNDITSQVIYTSNLQTAATMCDSIIQTTVNLNPVYNLTETETICSGESYTFPDGTIQNNITEQVVYTSNLQAVGTLCDSIIETTVNVNVVDVSVTQDQETLTANAASALYQWLDCDNNNNPVAGETNQVFTATSNGNYAVQVTQNECVDTSDCYDVTTILVTDNDFAKGIKVFPNPTDGLLKLDFGDVFQDVDITITDLQGRVVFRSEYNAEQYADIQFDEAPGVYIMSVKADSLEATIRLIRK